MKKIPFLLLENLVVLFFITILVLFGISKYNDVFNNYPKYVIIFKDIDGLSIGSPVRLAGLHIGYVVKQELKKDKILVTFKVTDRDVKIPEGSTADIEFTGLMGSKSLEIKPPQGKVKKDRELYPVNSIRVNSLLKIQNVLAGATLDFSNAILSFLRQNGKDADKNLKNASAYLKKMAYNLGKSREKIKNTAEEASQKVNELKDMLKDVNKKINMTGATINDLAADPELQNNIRQIKESTKNLKDFFEQGNAQDKINDLNKKVADLNKKLNALNKNKNKISGKDFGYINEVNESFKSVSQKLQKIIDSTKNQSTNNKLNSDS